MSTTITKQEKQITEYFYDGEDIKFSLNDKIFVIKIEKVDTEVTAVSVRYEVEK